MKKNTHSALSQHEIAPLSEIELRQIIHNLQVQNKELECRNAEFTKIVDDAVEVESKFRMLFEMSDDAILVIEKNMFVDCNMAVVKMLGYKSKEEMLNTHPSELSPPSQPDGQQSFKKAQEMMALAKKNGSHHFEWIHVRANGESFPVEVWLSALKHKGKYIINTIWRDLTEVKKAQAALSHTMQEKDVLLREIHHRVKNNLQVIVSLLRLQMNDVDSWEVKNSFEEAINRIMAISCIHQKLYQERMLSKIDLKSYLLDLANEICKLNFYDKKIDIHMETEVHYIGLHTISPLGLLVNELLVNSFKYAFSNDKQGSIKINVRKEEDNYISLEYSDNGKWIDSTSAQKGFGLDLIEILLDQLEGTMEKQTSEVGTKYSFVLKNLDYKLSS